MRKDLILKHELQCAVESINSHLLYDTVSWDYCCASSMNHPSRALQDVRRNVLSDVTWWYSHFNSSNMYLTPYCLLLESWWNDLHYMVKRNTWSFRMGKHTIINWLISNDITLTNHCPSNWLNSLITNKVEKAWKGGRRFSLFLLFFTLFSIY